MDLDQQVFEVKYKRKLQGASLGLGEILFHPVFLLSDFKCVLGHSVKFHNMVCSQKMFGTTAL